ncbi:hypothetical protein EOL70_30675 [Leucothrix sargassi]|jgi:IS1 family transposase|nr:hypothetical protein EOL70_30675 [Leucothrix sargassi]
MLRKGCTPETLRSWHQKHLAKKTKVGKRYTVDIKGNNNRFRQWLRLAYRKTCCFLNNIDSHFKAFDLLIHYVNYGWVL